MLTIPEEEITPKTKGFVGAVGRIVEDNNGDPTGNVLWFLVEDEKEFERAREANSLKTMRVKRWNDLKRALHRRQGDKPPGSTCLIEIPEVENDEKGVCLRYMRHVYDPSPKLLELNTPHYRSVSNALRYLRATGKDSVWIYKFGTEKIPRDYNNLQRYSGDIPGTYNARTSWGAMRELEGLIPESLRLKRGDVDISQLAYDRLKRTIPLKGMFGLRPANKKGMGTTAFMLVKLTPEAFRRAVKAAKNDPFSKKIKSGKPSKPMVRKWDLEVLLKSLATEISVELTSVDAGSRFQNIWYPIDYFDGNIQEIVRSLGTAFRTVRLFKKLEHRLWNPRVDNGPDYGQLQMYGFINRVLDVYRNLECLEAWSRAEKYDGLDELIPYIRLYGKRCTRENNRYQREKKIREAAAKAKEKTKTEKNYDRQEEAEKQGGPETRPQSSQEGT